MLEQTPHLLLIYSFLRWLSLEFSLNLSPLESVMIFALERTDSPIPNVLYLLHFLKIPAHLTK